MRPSQIKSDFRVSTFLSSDSSVDGVDEVHDDDALVSRSGNDRKGVDLEGGHVTTMSIQRPVKKKL